MFRPGSQGEFRHGLARHALVWRAKAVVAGWVRDGLGPVGRAKAVEAWSGKAPHGWARLGTASQSWNGGVRLG